MSTTDDLIASLCAEGRVDSDGGFTLDREQAREKLRTFQVAEPHRYVLHLIALAVLRGATAVDVRIDTDDVRVRFDGAPLSRIDFEDLYSSSVAEPRDDGDRARQQLAVALNAALALNPRWIRVVSGGDERVRLVARHGAEDVIEPAGESGDGTEIHVKQRFRPGLVVRFLKHVRKDMPEDVALRERCGYAPAPIAVNGEAIAHGLQLREPGLRHAALIEDGGRACAAALREDPSAPAEVRFVRHGVWITSLQPAHLPGGLLAVIRDDALRTDLSAQEVVLGAQLDRCMAVVDRAAEQVLLGRLGEIEPSGLARDDRARLRPVWSRWKRALDPETPLGWAINGLAWWSDIFGRPLSLADLRAEVGKRGHIGYTTAAFAGRLAEFPDLVVSVPPDASGEPNPDLVLLRELFGARLRDRTRELEIEVRREANRRRWLARPATPTLAGDHYRSKAPLRVTRGGRTLSGEVGLRRIGDATLRLIADGHLLIEQAVDLPLPVDLALAGVAPNLDLDGPVRDVAFVLAALAGLDAALGLMEDYLSSRTDPPDALHRSLTRAYLELRYDPDGPRRWLQRFGVAEAADDLGELAAAAGLQRICCAREGVPLATVIEPWLGELESFPTVSGGGLSLAAAALAIERAGSLAWTGARVDGIPGLDRIVLCLHGDALALAQLVFAARLRELTVEELVALRERHRFDAQPEEEVGLPPAQCFAQVRIEHGRMQAALGFTYDPDARPMRAAVRVLVEGRFVAERSIWSPVSHVRIVVRDDGLRPTGDYRDVVDDRAWKDTCAALQRAVPRLVAELVAALRGGQVAPPELLAHVLTASFPSAPLRTLWERLTAAEEPAQAEISYERVLALTLDAAPESLDKALRDAIREPPRRRKKRMTDRLTEIARLADRVGGKIDPQRGRFVSDVLRDIREACGQSGEGTLGERVAGAASELTALLRFWRVDGSLASVAELQAARARGEKLPLATYPPPDEQAGRQPPHAVCVDAATEDFLERLFGEAAMTWALLPAPPRQAVLRPAEHPRPDGPVLVELAIDDKHVQGVLWISPRRRAADRQIALRRDGSVYARVELLYGLTAGGVLSGTGIGAEGGRMTWTAPARIALMQAIEELYERLLRTPGSEATKAVEWALERLSDRGSSLPDELHPLRERLRAHLRRPVAPQPAAASDVKQALGEVFAELEAEARARGSAPRPGSAKPSPPPPPVPAAASPPPPPPPPEVQLLEAVRAELRALRELHDGLLSNFNLEHLRLSPQGEGAGPVTIGSEAVVLNGSHALVRDAAAGFQRDRAWVDFVASLVFTAFNEWRHEISDADEQAFHRLHLARLSRRVAEGHPPGTAR